MFDESNVLYFTSEEVDSDFWNNFGKLDIKEEEKKEIEKKKEDKTDEDKKESKSLIPIKPLEIRTTGLTGNNEFIISNEEIKVNQNENNTKKKGKRKRKRDDEGNQNENNEKIPRGDNIFKQIKIHGINFSIDTLNEFMNKVEFNHFTRFVKKEINDDIKKTVQKDYNLAILKLPIRNILCDDDLEDGININVIEDFKKYVVEKKIEENDFVLKFNSFLDKTFSEIIKIFNMSQEEYKKTYGLENNFLLECKETIKNKKYIKDLIESGISVYLNKKKERIKKKNNIH